MMGSCIGYPDLQVGVNRNIYYFCLRLFIRGYLFDFMDIEPIKTTLGRYKREGKRLFATSSFQTHSVVLLHVLSRIDPQIPVYFINTGFHFPETIRYKDMVTEMLDLKVYNLFPHVPKVMQTDAEGNLLFTFDPGYCCYLNKVEPVESLMKQYDVWINGIRADQNQNRSHFTIEEQVGHNTIRYHPLLKWSDETVAAYRHLYGLPVHPLEEKGYKSIGCEPCTRPVKSGHSREGRWVGMKRTECGLHVVHKGNGKQ